MKKRKWFFVLMVLVMVLLFRILISNDEGIKDNYYYSINRDVIEENELGDGEYSWSYFVEAQEKVDDDISLVVQDILKGDYEGLEEKEVRVIQNVYDKALDIDKRNEDGIKALEPYLDSVWDVATVDELVNVIIVVESELGIDILTNVEVVQDYQNNEKNIIYFYPVTYAFGASSDYMVDADYMAYKAYLRRACVELWKVYGYEVKEAREVVRRVFAFYDDVSEHSKLADELEDISSYYQVVSEEEVNGLFDKVRGKYLSRRGIGNRDVYSLVDKGQYQFLNDSLNLDNLEVWKEVIVTKILASYASYGSSDYVEVVERLNESLLGEKEENTKEDQAVNMIKNLFSSEIDVIYEKKFLSNKQEEEIEKIFLEIKKVYEKRLKANEWLSEEAKDKALIKLDKMKVIVGLDEDVLGYEIAGGLEVSDSSLISDVISIQQLGMSDDLERLASGERRDLVQQTIVNAYYQPLDNSIVIPVAFFELVNEYDSYYERLGTLGMILAHEVTHAFDGNGSQFDEDGNFNNWWSEEDKRIFNELKQEVSDYYSQYEVLDGKYINGEKTVNENIADLGAVACIVEIANAKKASNDDFKKMFSAFANIWASRESEEYMELLLLQDVHAPNQFRVNAVLSSIEEFYQVYDIYPWNDMWTFKSDRVRVW